MVDTNSAQNPAIPERPIAPHLQIYRWTIPMALSILHRFTGMALAAGTLLLTWWLVATALGPQTYAQIHALMTSWLGMLVLLGFSFSLILHFLNGIRHLVMDAGAAFELKRNKMFSMVVIVGGVVLTAAFWLYLGMK